MQLGSIRQLGNLLEMQIGIFGPLENLEMQLAALNHLTLGNAMLGNHLKKQFSSKRALGNHLAEAI